MDSRFARDDVRRAITVNRGLRPSAPMSMSSLPASSSSASSVSLSPPMTASASAPSVPSAAFLVAMQLREQPPGPLGWQGFRPPVLRGGSPAWSYSRFSTPPPPPPPTQPVVSSASSASPRLPFTLGPFCPGQRLEPGCRQQEEDAWSWHGDDCQQLPSFGARTAAASSSTEMAGSLGSTLTSASGTSPDFLLTDSPDIDEFTTLALTSLTESCGRLGLQDSNGSLMQPHSANMGDQTQLMQRGSPGSSGRGIRRPGIRRPGLFCAFCKGNGELPRTYTSHTLHRELQDGTVIVTCEVLRSLKCELCGASGDIAHTRSHCPYNKQPSVAVLLKNTPRRCDGSLRRKNKDRK